MWEGGTGGRGSRGGGEEGEQGFCVAKALAPLEGDGVPRARQEDDLEHAVERWRKELSDDLLGDETDADDGDSDIGHCRDWV